MSRKNYTRWLGAVLVLSSVMSGGAATFGTGDNAFDLGFQPISSETNPSGLGQVAYDYGIGTYEITADQWAKYVTITGGPVGVGSGYDDDPTTTGNQAVNYTSWYEAAQFVNWLNTSSDYAPAYNFDATGTFSLWSDGEQSATSAYRHKDAIYVLPSEDEWVKAAYWNGTKLQTYATPDAGMPTTTEANYNNDYGSGSVWSVGTGAVELNGTYDMMGNVTELMETAADTDAVGENRIYRGGSYIYNELQWLASGKSQQSTQTYESDRHGFRVAAVPEPASIALVGLFGGGVLFIRRIFMM